MTLTMASCRSDIFVISSRNKPLSWTICLSIDLLHFITPLETNTRTLSRPIPTSPAATVGTGWNETAGKTTTFTRGLLRNQKYADIFEKKPTILSLTWRIYGIQYVKVDIQTNKPLNGQFRFRLSCRLRYRYGQQTRFYMVRA